MLIRSNYLYYPLHFQDACVCSDQFFAFTVKPGNKIAVWNFSLQEKMPLYLVGHHLKITAIALTAHDHGRHLCSCSSDNIIMWDLLQNGGRPYKGKVLLSNIDRPSCCSFSHDETKLLLCLNKALLVFDLKSMTHVTVEVQLNKIHLYALLPGERFLTVDENNLCKLWNLPTLDVVSKKYVIPSSPSSIAVQQKSRLVALGTNSGNLYCFRCDNGFSLVRSIQIWRILKNFQKRRGQDVSCNEDDVYTDESNVPVLSICFYSQKCSSEKNHNWVLPEAVCIAVVTTSWLFLFCINTEEVLYCMNFTEKFAQVNPNKLGLIQSAVTYYSDSSGVIHIVLMPVIGTFIVALQITEVSGGSEECLNERFRKLDIHEHCEQNDAERMNNETLSFLSRSTSTGDQSFLICKKNSFASGHSAFKSGSSLPNLCQRTTLHKRKITSSGYGLIKRCAMFQPKTNFKKPSSSCKNSRSQVAAKFFRNAKGDERNVFSHEKPVVLCTVAFSNAPVITSSHFAGDGRHALCGLNDGSVEILRIGSRCAKPLSTMCGHTQSLTSAKWSHSMDLIVTSGADRVARLWRSSNNKFETALIIRENSSRRSGYALNCNTKTEELFPDVVAHAQFYYVDKFVLTACKNTLYMFEYTLNPGKTDLVRYEKNNSKLVVKVLLSSHRITAVAGVNQFYSNLVLCAGSSKCLDVCDMNTGSVVWHADDVSVKPPFLIALNEGSANVNQPSAMYDVFMTSSLFDGIKLWDLRTRRCVLSYKEHQSSSLRCGGAFSACGKYIASGSEDRSIYIYDLRSTFSLHRLTDCADIITNIAFSPTQPQFLASSVAGKVFLYGQGTG